MKIGYQLKQVRERLCKGLVDKGILRTEKRNFLLFDMATHPVADGGAKEEIRRRVRNVLTQRTVVLQGSQWLPENLEFRYVRTISMVCAAYAANVLENALSTLGHEARERAFTQTDELLAEYSQWPFDRKVSSTGIGANLPQAIADVRLINHLNGLLPHCPAYAIFLFSFTQRYPYLNVLYFTLQQLILLLPTSLLFFTFILFHSYC